MKTIIIIIIYALLLVLLDNSKLKTTWVIWIAFTVGWFVDELASEIINLIN